MQILPEFWVRAAIRAGGIVVIQRLRWRAQPQFHFHALILDGVFAPADGGLRFLALDELTTLDVEEVRATVEALVARRLHRQGLTGDGDDAMTAWLTRHRPLPSRRLDRMEAALRSSRGARPARLGTLPTWTEPRPPGHCHSRSCGFCLPVALIVPAGQRDRLERLCRCVLPPPVAVERLHVTHDGEVRVSLREPWWDGTTDFVFDPVDFLARLAVLCHGRGST